MSARLPSFAMRPLVFVLAAALPLGVPTHAADLSLNRVELISGTPFAEGDAVVAEDVVGGCGVEVEVGEDEGLQVGGAGHRHFLSAANGNVDDGLAAAVHRFGGGSLHLRVGLLRAVDQLSEGCLDVWERREVRAGEPGGAARHGVGCDLHLAREREHVRGQAAIHEHAFVDLLRGRVRLGGLLMLLPRFAWLSLLAGIDVARRVFSPNMPLATGFVDYKTDFPRGHARNNFATITSLMPGTVPSGDGPDTIEFHCLDTGQPVAAQMAAEERLLARALVPGRRDD